MARGDADLGSTRTNDGFVLSGKQLFFISCFVYLCCAESDDGIFILWPLVLSAVHVAHAA